MEELKNYAQLDYSEDEKGYLSYLLTRIKRARDIREQSHWQFNNVNYSTWYQQNAKASVGFIPPRANPTDTEITTAFTSQKIKTLINILKGFEYSLDITSIDQDNRIQVEMGNVMENLVKQTKRSEKDDLEKKRIRYKELVEQGDVFVEEYFSERQEVRKIPTGEFTGQLNYKWTEKLEKVLGRAETKVIPGLNFYAGDINNPDMDEQPFLFTASLISYQQAKSKYGKWERFKNVPRDLVSFDDASYYGAFILSGEENIDKVEEIKYYDKWNNEFMIILNGVMMMPIKFPMEIISPSRDYPIAKGSVFPRKDFFYSKSLAADTKVLQEVIDSSFMSMVWKHQYSSRPSVVNNSGRELPAEVYQGGLLMGNVQNPESIVSLFPNIQITEADFSYFQLINDIGEKNSFSSIIEGLGAQGGTATESIQQQRNSMKKIGNVIDGVVALENKLYWLRIYNILKNYTKDDNIKKVYRKIITRVKENGRDGYKVFSFDAEKAKQNPKRTAIEANILSNENLGEKIDIVYIDPKFYKESIENTWIVNVIPETSSASELQKAQLLELVNTVAAFAPQQMNVEYILNRIISLSGEDPSKWLMAQGSAQSPEQVMAAAMGKPTGKIEDELRQGVGNQSKQPSINTLQGTV